MLFHWLTNIIIYSQQKGRDYNKNLFSELIA